MLSLKMGSNLSCYQLIKIVCYIFKLLHVNFMVTTEQIPIVNIQKRKRKESKYTTKGRHQTTKEEKKRVKVQIEL